MSECEHYALQLDMYGTRYYCVDCDVEFEVPLAITATGSDNTVNRKERSSTMWNSNQAGTVSREEAVAYIERKADEQGIGQGFKVYYDFGDGAGRTEVLDESQLPERVVLANLHVSASLNQAYWCRVADITLSPMDLML